MIKSERLNKTEVYAKIRKTNIINLAKANNVFMKYYNNYQA